jgi:hypothetical protein
MVFLRTNYARIYRQPAAGRRIYPAPCKKCGGKGRVTARNS